MKAKTETKIPDHQTTYFPSSHHSLTSLSKYNEENDLFEFDYSKAKKEEWHDYYIDYKEVTDGLSWLYECDKQRRKMTKKRKEKQGQVKNYFGRHSSAELCEMGDNNEEEYYEDDNNKNDIQFSIFGKKEARRQSITSKYKSLPGNLDSFQNGENVLVQHVNYIDDKYQNKYISSSTPSSAKSTPMIGRNHHPASLPPSSAITPQMATATASTPSWIQSEKDHASFCSLLNSQLQKVALFYISEQGKIAQSLSNLSNELSTLSQACHDFYQNINATSNNNEEEWTKATCEYHVSTIHSTMQNHVALGSSLLELLHFLAVNVCTLRKILELHDLFMRKLRKHSSASHHHRAAPLYSLHKWYEPLISYKSSAADEVYISHSPLVPLMNKDMVLSLSHCVGKNIKELNRLERMLTKITTSTTATTNSARQSFVESIRSSFAGYSHSTVKTETFLVEIDSVVNRMKSAEHESIKDYVVEGSIGNNLYFEHSLLSEKFLPQYNNQKHQNNMDMHYYATFLHDREQKKKLEVEADGDDDDKKEEDNLLPPLLKSNEVHLTDTKDKLTWKEYYLPLTLNLVSTFFYMTNYNIAGPTSVKYVETLGGHGALAGMLIGATPWAAMVSTFLFSIWTNYSFKAPLLCSSILLCLGNLMYALALHFDSIELIMAGRMMIGLGGPRAINRRYIADTAPFEQRTAVSAAFVTFTAAGVAVGPGLSVILQSIDTTFYFPLMGQLKLNGLTGPGYCMFILWFGFLITMVFTFEEPERIGLHEISEKEISREKGETNVNGEKNCSLSTSQGFYVDPATKAKYFICKENDEELQSPNINDDWLLGESERSIEKYGIWSNNNDGTHNYGSVDKNDTTEAAETIEVMPPNLHILEDGDDSNPSAAHCLSQMNWPTWLCMILLFMDKLALESLVSSSPIITQYRYNWTVSQVGALGFTIGLLVIPLSIMIGWLSRQYEDRQLLIWLLYCTVAGLVLLIDATDFNDHNKEGPSEDYSGIFEVGPYRYIYGCLISFASLQAMESIIMSTLSKVVPYALAVGTCNSGLINTEIGTLGRAVGDLVVTCLGLVSLQDLLNSLISPVLIFVIGCIILVKINFKAIAV